MKHVLTWLFEAPLSVFHSFVPATLVVQTFLFGNPVITALLAFRRGDRAQTLGKRYAVQSIKSHQLTLNPSPWWYFPTSVLSEGELYHPFLISRLIIDWFERLHGVNTPGGKWKSKFYFKKCYCLRFEWSLDFSCDFGSHFWIGTKAVKVKPLSLLCHR